MRAVRIQEHKNTLQGTDVFQMRHGLHGACALVARLDPPPVDTDALWLFQNAVNPLDRPLLLAFRGKMKIIVRCRSPSRSSGTTGMNARKQWKESVMDSFLSVRDS
jgi:hypothetical protein